MLKLIVTTVLALMLSAPALAFTREELKAGGVPDSQIPSMPDLVEKNADLGDIPTFRDNGALSWGALANLNVSYIARGPGMTDIRREVRGEVQALSGREVRIEGFMYPLKAGETHDYFLIAGLPPSCPFCLPGGPAEMVEVKAGVPVPTSNEPVMLTGRFEVLENDPTGMIYRMTDAKLAD